jgi:hypothetical protein
LEKPIWESWCRHFTYSDSSASTKLSLKQQ